MNTYGVVFYLLSQNIIDMIFIPVFVFIVIFLFWKIKSEYIEDCLS